MAEAQPLAKPSLVKKFAAKYSIEADKILDILKATAFRVKDQPVTNEQMAALLIVADQYGLNPFTKEIYAFPDKGGIVPVVGVDGWARIVNEHPQYDGVDFAYSEDPQGLPVWTECHIFRKDRSHPTKVRERFSECKRSAIPWNTHPHRMLRHKAYIQCARLAFGFGGIYDEDEAARIIEGQVVEASPVPLTSGGVKSMEERIRTVPKEAEWMKEGEEGAPPVANAKEKAEELKKKYGKSEPDEAA